MTATGTGGELLHAPSWRGKNASPAADRRHTFTFPACGDGVAIWGASGAFLSTPMIAPPRGTCRRHPDARCQPCRPAESAAPAQTPLHRAAGNRVERAFRGEFRLRVLVATKHLRRFQPCDGCCREAAITRRAAIGSERKPISGVQRRRRPDRQECMVCDDRTCCRSV